MRIAFFGTSEFAVESLKGLADSGHEVVQVITRPDGRKDRGHQVHPSPVKEKALELGLPIFQPTRVNDEESTRVLKQLQADLFVVVSYGSILGEELLKTPPYGALNVHPSLLPAYRGAAPIQRTLMDGLSRTGVTIMEMVRDLDAGPILRQEEIDVPSDWNQGDLSDALAGLGAQLLLTTITALEEDHLQGVEQDHEEASYAKKVQREEKYISFNHPANVVHDKIRGLAPKWTPMVSFKGKLLGILKTEIQKDGQSSGLPGEVMEINKEAGILVQCAKGALWLKTLKPEGKKVMAFRDYLNGSHLSVGDQLLSKKEESA